MPRGCRLSSVVAVLLACSGGRPLTADAIDFVRDIQPIFVRHCLSCHAGESAESGLRLDIRSEAFRGGESHGPAIVPGDADASPLVRFVRGDDPQTSMPPRDAGLEPLTAEEVAHLVAWIDAGAVWPDGIDAVGLVDRREHWSFRRVVRSRPPSVENEKWPRGDLDRFILARLEAAGLAPTSEADRRTWLRRVTLDLTGLPPHPDELAAFLADQSADAYERVVDRLLASPRYGERYAQHWLDVVRYADTHGYEVNTERTNAWPYRDWVIAAFNGDLPYDRFVREQLVGDAFGTDAATGFLVTAAVLLPGQIGADDVSKRAARQDALADVITNIADTFLGLSVGCARCHDHKFDPVSQRDYYALQAFVSGVRYEDRPYRSPASDAARSRIEQMNARLTAIDAELASLGEPADGGDTMVKDTLAQGSRREVLEADKKEIQAKISQEEPMTRVFAGGFTEPDVVCLLRRGDAEQPAGEVLPRSPEVFDDRLTPVSLTAAASEQTRRLALADWLVHVAHPLTARVIVNRIWQWHFGTGIVESSNDFGRNGMPPSHPELLDWLADQLVAEGWSIKRLHRLIVLSASYRQASVHGAVEQAVAVDAACRLLWRFPARRLEAEAIRDGMLAVSGRLNLEMGGRGFDLFASRGGLSGFPPIETFGPEGRRRMVYAHKIRMEKESVFGAFDCPDAGQTLDRRHRSMTAIQALNLFNSPFTIEESRAFAARVMSEVRPTVADASAGTMTDDLVDRQVTHAFRLALARPPDQTEREACVAVANEHGLEAVCRVLFNSNEFLFIP